MITITVKNVGPIKEVQLDLKKINILIGQQSTGKSTLAKIACYCSWVEKEICLSQGIGDFSKDGYFERNLTEFHKLNGYITGKSVISYKSEVLSFQFIKNKFSLEWTGNRLSYKRKKTLYIPAERNLISIIPNWFEVNLGQNSTRSFLADWEHTRKYFSRKKPLRLLNFGVYYHRSTDKSDHIVTKEEKDILISNASSGLQSLIPLQALVTYYADIFYSKGLRYKESNVTLQSKFQNLFNELYDQLFDKLSDSEKTEWEAKKAGLHLSEDVPLRQFVLLYPDEKFRKVLFELINQILIPDSTAFFIEEPELNLYPITQYNLVKNLIELINKRSHSIFITTHSPYILTSLNNLIFAGEKGKQNPGAVANIIPKTLWIKRSDVSAWKINADSNELENLLDEEIPMLKAEEIDDVSQIINKEFDSLFEI